jgi:pimeloyl-ACP methyl ester carboxylesterase
MKIDNHTSSGVFIEHTGPESPSDRAPIVFIHGGNHGSWCWENFMSYFAETGRDCYGLNWFGHNGSSDLPREEFLTHSLSEVSREVNIAVSELNKVPVLITHSMGALVAQKYAEEHPVAAQVHLAPSPCQQVGRPPIRLSLNLNEPFAPPPFEQAYQMFFAGCPEADARRYYSLLCDESPQAVFETALTASVPVDRSRLGGPMLMISGEHDFVAPPENVRQSAEYFGADYLFLHGKSHSMLLEPGWLETVKRIDAWLDHQNW